MKTSLCALFKSKNALWYDDVSTFWVGLTGKSVPVDIRVVLRLFTRLDKASNFSVGTLLSSSSVTRFLACSGFGSPNFASSVSRTSKIGLHLVLPLPLPTELCSRSKSRTCETI